MRAPGRTPEGITSRSASRAALAGAAALVLAAGGTANPSIPQPVLAAPTATPAPLEQVLPRLLFDRAERTLSPAATRRTRPVVRAVAKPVRRVAHHAVRHRPARTVQHHKARRGTVRVTLQRSLGASGSARSVVAFGLAQQGDPYVYGADGPGSWDCSGLTRAAFARAGVRLPRRASAQSARGYRVSRAQARPGDLVIWGGVGSAYHVGIYLGRSRVLHSPRPGKSVRVAPLWGHPQFRRLV